MMREFFHSSLLLVCWGWVFLTGGLRLITFQLPPENAPGRRHHGLHLRDQRQRRQTAAEFDGGAVSGETCELGLVCYPAYSMIIE